MTMDQLQQVKFTIAFIIVLEVLLHLFSLAVSASPLLDFVGAYITIRELTWIAGGIALVMIEIAVWRFPEMAYRAGNHLGLRVLMVIFATASVGISMYLTTIGAGQVASGNVSLLEDVEVRDITEQNQRQLQEDKEKLKALYLLRDNRKNNFLWENEREQMLKLEERIDKNTDRVNAEHDRVLAENKDIASQNNAMLEASEKAHTSFGFLTQVALVLIVIARIYLEELKLTATGNKQVWQQKETVVAHALPTTATTGQQVGNNKKTRKQKNISISEETIRTIGKLSSNGLTRSEIENETGFNRSTISKALYQLALEYHKGGNSVDDIAKNMDIDKNKLIEKIAELNGNGNHREN